MIDALSRDLEELESAGLRRSLRVCERLPGAALRIGERVFADFASNDYLGLATDPRLTGAARSVAPAGAGAARLISGNHALHAELESEIARFKRTEAALLFPSGYMANVGAITALVRRGDVIYADALNHASLIDAARLSRAAVRVFRHRDVEQLESMLRADAGCFRRRIVVTDGVFSMDGDVAPLDRLVSLAHDHDAWLYVDDAHGTGVLGATGRGTPEEFGVEAEVHVTMGTLGKAFGTAGAFIAGPGVLIDFLVNNARAFIFTTGTPPGDAASSMEALRISRAEPWRRRRLQSNVATLAEGLGAAGVTTAPGCRHIVPIVLGDAARTMNAARMLLGAGFFVAAVRPPTVAPGSSRLRVSLSAAHTDAQIRGLVSALAEALQHA